MTANLRPAKMLAVLKANATRSMKDAGCWRGELSPWARGGSKRYIWTEKELANAVAYVMEDQGEPLGDKM